MKQLIERSYKAIRARGLITDSTQNSEFIAKMQEELQEATIAMFEDDYIEELTDLATVCIMQIRHLGYDFENEFEKVVLKNESRANNITK